MIWSCGYNEDTLRIFMGCSWVLVITSKTWWCTEESSVIPTTPAGILSPHERGWNAKYEGTPTQNCHEMMVYIPYIAGWNIHIYWYIIHIYIYTYIYIYIYIYILFMWLYIKRNTSTKIAAWNSRYTITMLTLQGGAKALRTCYHQTNYWKQPSNIGDSLFAKVMCN
jgi:hypothetical protein